MRQRTIVFVTHDMESVQKFCDRAMVIKNGKIEFLGLPPKAAVLYKEENFPTDTNKEKNNITGDNQDRLKIELTDNQGFSKKTFVSGETMVVNSSWDKDSRVHFVGVAIHRDDGMYIFGTNNQNQHRSIALNQNSSNYSVNLNLGSGQYYVEVAIFGKDESDKIFYTAHGPSFVVHNPNQWQGVTELTNKWASQ